MREFIPWPRSVPRRDGCDVLIGSCSCGMTHTPAEVAEELVRLRAQHQTDEALIRDWERGYGEVSREAAELRARISTLEALQK